MQTIQLPHTGRTTSRLGFGCSSLMGAMGRRQSLAVLESAFDAGIRHFDTAPMYGYGESESCLGEFLVRHRAEVTVTTKFGIPPASNRAVLRLARSIAGPVLVRFPGLKKQVQRTLSFQATSVRATPVQNAPDLKRPGERRPNPIFTVPQALASLERSLRALQTDHVDLWLLHEVRPEDLASDPANDPLLRLMEDVVQQGKVGAFGVGSDSREVPSLVATRPAYCGVTQFDWSVLDPALPETASFRIHHRALTERFTSLAAWLKSHEELCRQWSHEVGADLSNAATLAQLMLKASLVFNPRSVVLFSSKRRQNMLTNAATVEDSALEAPARALHSLLQQERPALS